MKLKYEFVINTVAGSSLAVPVGEDAAGFKGYVKLNETGAFIFKYLMKGAEREEIVSGILGEFSDVDRESAEKAVDGFLNELKESGVLCD